MLLDTHATYEIDWRSGFIGGRATIYTGANPENALQALGDGRPVTVIKATKKRGRKSIGIGKPQSARDR